MHQDSQQADTGSDFTPGLTLITSNRLERLAERLARTLASPLSSPLSPEVIIIQSRGMERWITMEIARINGVFGNGHFPFPNAFFNEISRLIIPGLESEDDSAFYPEIMTWRIMQLLPECLDFPAFRPLKRYLADDSSGLKRYQLSRRISDLFDQYLVFRPDFILRWEQDEERDWQALLWRRLSQGCRSLHRARMRLRVLEEIQKREKKPAGVPDRLSVFGISYLPPFFLEVFAALARWIPVQVFFISPCREFWAHLAGRRETHRIIRKYRDNDRVSEEDLHLDEGNRLLAAMGKLGRDFLHLISDWETDGEESFEAPGDDSLLHRVQGDLLDMNNPEAGRPAPADRSIQIHCAHSPMREVEILHDQLLAMFEELPGLAPRDILVMTPDIDAYAPFIHAVFDHPGEESMRIPYRIADRSLRSEGQIGEQLLSILRIVGGRLGVAEVFEILRYPGVRGRFHLDESEIDLLERWVRDAGIRWGKDGSDKARLDLPADSANTWEAGLYRLLLGYAMPDENCLVLGSLPYGAIEGNEAQILGRFLEFVHTLFGALEQMKTARPLSRWHELLMGLLTHLFQPQNTPEIRAIRDGIETLSRLEKEAGFHGDVGLEVVRAWFAHRLDNRYHESGFLSGDVTFCAMLPMRSIPFRVVSMIGMNGSSFPRDSHPLGFDLMAAEPRIGDRCRRDDDKYLFLEALISARDRLYISYVGQSVQDNSIMPPSVLVSELIDFLRQGYGVSEKEALTRHRLHGFSQAYFIEGSPLFSYCEENLKAAQSLHSPKYSPPFFSGPLSSNESDAQRWQQVDLADLREFFIHPIRFLFTRRLDLALEREEDPPDDREPFSLDGLQEHLIGRDLTDRALADETTSSSYELERCRGRLPVGAPGQALFSQLGVAADAFVRKIRGVYRGDPMEPLEIRIDLDGYTLSGVLDGVYTSGRHMFRYGRARAKDLISAWIDHLAICAAASGKEAFSSFLIFRDGAWRLDPVKDARTQVESLVGLFWKGLDAPIPFFPETSMEYAKASLLQHADGQAALSRARRKWGGEFVRGESEDPYHRLCFRGVTDPLDKTFCDTAEAVWSPFFRSASEVAL